MELSKEIFDKNKILGIIFDCDGVLVDSEKLSCGALNVVFEKYFNTDIGTDYSPVIGRSLKDGFAYYIHKHNIIVPPDLDLSILYREKDAAYKNLAKNILQSFPGVIEFLKHLENTSLKKAVASSGTIDKINFNLTQGKLASFFKIISSSEEVMNGKPHPDLFLLTAKKMNVLPRNCMVLEDSVLGIQGAKAANMLAVGVTTSFNEDSLRSAGADFVIKRLDDLLKH